MRDGRLVNCRREGNGGRIFLLFIVGAWYGWLAGWMDGWMDGWLVGGIGNSLSYIILGGSCSFFFIHLGFGLYLGWGVVL